jgi:hypothetical protein
MTLTRRLRIALATVACVAIAAPAAFAAGEPKNQWPFTRPVGESSPAALGSHAGLAGEPKNELPFTRTVAGPTVLLRTSDGFDWADAGIGALAAVGLAVVALAGVALRTANGRRPRVTGA